MGMIEITKEQAEVAAKAVADMFEALTPTNQEKFTKPFVHILLFLAAAKQEAPPESGPKVTCLS